MPHFMANILEHCQSHGNAQHAPDFLRLFVFSRACRVTAPPTCMTAGRAGAARTRTRTTTARIPERPRRVSPLFSAGEDPPAAATEPVAAAEPTKTTEAEGGAEGATEEVEEKKPLSELEIAKMEKLAEIERLRSKEVFITEKTGNMGFLILCLYGGGQKMVPPPYPLG